MEKRSLWQKCLLGITILLLSISSYAQTAHYRIGSNRNEIATVIKTLNDGSSIIGGYIYDIDPATQNLTQSDMLLLHVALDGTIKWQKQFGTTNGPNAGNDFVKDLIIAKNGDIIVVGIVGRANDMYTNNTAAIYRFDTAHGNLLAANFVRDAASVPGDVFNSVAELDNGDLVAVGAHDFTPDAVDGMLSVFDASLNLRYTEKRALSASSDVYTSIVAHGNSVNILAYRVGATWYDVVLMDYTSGTTAGVVNWMYNYDISYTITTKDHTVVANVNSNWPLKLYITNNYLFISGIANDSYTAGSASRHFIMRTDRAGLAPHVRVVNDAPASTLPAMYSNTQAFFPLGDEDMFTAQVPGAAPYDPSLTGVVPAGSMHPFVSRMTSYANGTIGAKTHFPLPGNQSILDMVAAHNLAFMAGNIGDNSTGYGGNDIYFGQDVYALKDTSSCAPDTTVVVDSTNTTPNALVINSSPVPNNPNVDTFTNNARLTDSLLCGKHITKLPDSCCCVNCNMQCYWRTTGNNTTTSSNFLGTINSADLIVKTTNVERARFDQNGNTGINTATPQAILDVNCIPTPWPSGLRFQNLPVGRGSILVIDPAGYVYMADMSAGDASGGNSSAGSTQQQINDLKQQIAQLQQQLNNVTGNSDINSGNSLSVSPNPTNGQFNAYYTIGKSFQSAAIRVTDNSGNIIITTPVTNNTGILPISIPPSAASGQLNCTLFIDNKIVATQKIVLLNK